MKPAWQEITSRAAQKSLAVMCPASFPGAVRAARPIHSARADRMQAGTLARPGDGSAIGRTPAARRRHTPPPPPSIRNERARSLPAAAAISGKRPDQSGPLRVISRTPAGSRRTIMRKPSSFISWIQSGPDGGRSAGEGRQGSINADTRIDADRCQLQRYVQSDIVLHCSPP